MNIVTPTRGLENVTAAESALADVDGTVGTLRLCGYDIHDLAERCSFEEVLALLWTGELPRLDELAEVRAELASARQIGDMERAVIRALPGSMHPMDALRTAVSSLAGMDAEAEHTNQEAARRIAVRLVAQIPVLTAAIGRVQREQAIVEPRQDLGHSANLLWMYHGTEPTTEHIAALDTYMVLLAEHSLNASTFAARVVIGAGGDVYGAITAAIAALKGSVHGGANQKAYEMLEAMGGDAGVDPYVEASIPIKRRIMGIGHRIYKVEDPRVRHLRKHSEQLIATGIDPTIHRTAEALQRLTAEHPYFAERKLAPNVEFFSAPLLGALGFPAAMFPALFACSRSAGWTAHIFEQLRDNRLIRPKAAYTGPALRPFIEIDERPLTND